MAPVRSSHCRVKTGKEDITYTDQCHYIKCVFARSLRHAICKYHGGISHISWKKQYIKCQRYPGIDISGCKNRSHIFMEHFISYSNGPIHGLSIWPVDVHRRKNACWLYWKPVCIKEIYHMKTITSMAGRVWRHIQMHLIEVTYLHVIPDLFDICRGIQFKISHIQCKIDSSQYTP